MSETKKNVLGFSDTALEAIRAKSERQEDLFNALELKNTFFSRPEFDKNGNPSKENWAFVTLTYNIEGHSLSVRTFAQERNGRVFVRKIESRTKNGDTVYRNISVDPESLWALAEVGDKLECEAKQYGRVLKKWDGEFSIFKITEDEDGNEVNRGWIPAKDVGINLQQALKAKAMMNLQELEWADCKVFTMKKRAQSEEKTDAKAENAGSAIPLD